MVHGFFDEAPVINCVSPTRSFRVWGECGGRTKSYCLLKLKGVYKFLVTQCFVTLGIVDQKKTHKKYEKNKKNKTTP